MRKNAIAEKIAVLFKRLSSKLKIQAPRLQHAGAVRHDDNHGGTLSDPHSMAYNIIGERAERFLPLFREMDVNLRKAGMKVNFKAYVSLTMFSSILASVIVLISAPCVLLFAFRLRPVPAALFGVGGGLFALAFTTIGFYAYPIYRADSHKRGLEDELPFTTGYMAILTSAGVSPEKIFYSLSELPVPLAISAEAKDVVRDVSLFGSDIISALENVSKRTPSEKFGEMIEGLISTIHSGGNLSSFLREKSKQFMKLKRISLKKYSDTLSMLSEFYVALLLTGPLLLIIMLSVMAMLGGGGLGMLSPDLLLGLLTYIGIPIGAVVFLILLDTVSPKW